MPVELRVPKVGESITEVQVGDWLISDGDPVQRDQPVVVLETDKATVELPAPVAGKVTKRLKAKGEIAKVGEVIGLMEEGAVPAAAKPTSPAKPAELKPKVEALPAAGPAAPAAAPAAALSEGARSATESKSPESQGVQSKNAGMSTLPLDEPTVPASHLAALRPADALARPADEPITEKTTRESKRGKTTRLPKPRLSKAPGTGTPSAPANEARKASRPPIPAPPKPEPPKSTPAPAAWKHETRDVPPTASTPSAPRADAPVVKAPEAKVRPPSQVTKTPEAKVPPASRVTKAPEAKARPASQVTKSPTPKPAAPPPALTPPASKAGALSEARRSPEGTKAPESKGAPAAKKPEESSGTLASWVSSTRQLFKKFTGAPPEVRIQLPSGDLKLFKLDGDIDERMALKAATWVLFVQAMKADADLTIAVDITGGSLNAGLSLIDVLLNAKCRVRTHCARQAMGIGSMILAAGNKGFRTVSRAAILTAPVAMKGADGKIYSPSNPKALQAFAAATGCTPAQVDREILTLKSITPKLAVKHGIADAVAI